MMKEAPDNASTLVGLCEKHKLKPRNIPEGTFKTNSRQQKYLDYFLVDKI